MRNQKKIWDDEYSAHGNKWKKETKMINFNFSKKKVLEIGVGNGKTLSVLIKSRADNVTGIDFSIKAIEICKKKFNDRVRFIVCDATKMLFLDDEFDVVVCYYVLNNLLVDDRVRVVNEINRVLKKGGKILFEDFSVGDFRQKGKEIEENTTVKENGLICHFFFIDELKELFSDFSFYEFNDKISFPFRNNKGLKRAIINGIVEK